MNVPFQFVVCPQLKSETLLNTDKKTLVVERCLVIVTAVLFRLIIRRSRHNIRRSKEFSNQEREPTDTCFVQILRLLILRPCDLPANTFELARLPK